LDLLAFGRWFENPVEWPRSSRRHRRPLGRHGDRWQSRLGRLQGGFGAFRLQLLAQGRLLPTQLLQLLGVLPAQTLDQGIALRVHALAQTELLQADGKLVHVGLQPAQPLGQALDADGPRVGIGQQVGDQALALAGGVPALIRRRGNQERGECEDQGDGTAQHQPAAQPRREPFPAICEAHHCPPRSEGRGPLSWSDSPGRTAT
jgi:hypothetical protein